MTHRSAYHMFVRTVLAALGIAAGASLLVPVTLIAAVTDDDGPSPRETIPIECLTPETVDIHECNDWFYVTSIEETETGYALSVTACRLVREFTRETKVILGVDAGVQAGTEVTDSELMCTYAGECGTHNAAYTQTR